MKRWLIAATLFAAIVPASAFWQSRDSNYNVNITSGGAVTCSSSEGNNFLARLTGSPDDTHKTAYCTLIDGLVTDSVWTKLDALYMFATDTSANALLNLVSATGNAGNVSATFTADAGFAGNGTNQYVDTNMNSTTFVQYTLDSAHFSLWGKNAAPSNFGGIHGILDATSDNLYLRSGNATGATACGNLNTNSGTLLCDSAANSAEKHHIINRSASNAQQFYVNGSSAATNTLASVSVPTGNDVWIGCRNNNGSVNQCSDQQFMAASLGASLNGTEAGNLYARVHAYLQTIAGIP